MEQPEKHPEKNVWGPGGVREGQYARHSVHRDCKFFIGWPRLQELIASIKSPTYQDVAKVAFACAGRITETLQSQGTMFKADYEIECMIVKGFPLEKRWKATDKIIICERCQTRNSRFEAVCTKCGANLTHSGKREYVTEKIVTVRNDFFFPLKEPFCQRIIELTENHPRYLFVSSYTGKPYTRQWAYATVKDYGKLVGLDNLYNHYWKSQRLMQLKNEYGFSKDELKDFSGIKEDETLDFYAKSIQTYTEKMGLKDLATQQMMEQQRLSSGQAFSADSSKSK